MFQHNAVASGGVPAGAGQLHGILMRLAAHRRDGEYIAAIIDASARRDAWSGDDLLHAVRPRPPRCDTPGPLRGAGRRSPGPTIVPCAACAVARRRSSRTSGRASSTPSAPARSASPRARSSSQNASRLSRSWASNGHARRTARSRTIAASAILLQETASPGLCLSGLMSAAFLLAHPPGRRSRRFEAPRPLPAGPRDPHPRRSAQTVRVSAARRRRRARCGRPGSSRSASAPSSRCTGWGSSSTSATSPTSTVCCRRGFEVDRRVCRRPPSARRLRMAPVQQ